jgi:hypothetical protein
MRVKVGVPYFISLTLLSLQCVGVILAFSVDYIKPSAFKFGRDFVHSKTFKCEPESSLLTQMNLKFLRDVKHIAFHVQRFLHFVQILIEIHFIFLFFFFFYSLFFYMEIF